MGSSNAVKLYDWVFKGYMFGFEPLRSLEGLLRPVILRFYEISLDVCKLVQISMIIKKKNEGFA